MEHFDKEGLTRRVKNNTDLLAKLIEIAKEDIPEDLANLEKYFKESDYKSLKETGHSLKGTGLNMGFNIFADIAYKVEKIEEAEYQNIPKLISDLKNEFEIVLKEIEVL